MSGSSGVSSSSSEEHHLLSHLSGWTAGELEFLAEDCEVEVIPLASEASIPLLRYQGSGQEIGPFRPPLPATVPLWMAIQMKKQRRASLRPPAWMSVPYLNSWLEEESLGERFKSPPIRAFAEVARLILCYAREDVDDAEEVEEKLRSIQEIRQSKIEKGLKLINDRSSFVTFNNIGTLELNTLRSLTVTALSKFQQIHAATEDAIQSHQNQSQSQQNGMATSSQIPPSQPAAGAANGISATQLSQARRRISSRNSPSHNNDSQAAANHSYASPSSSPSSAAASNFSQPGAASNFASPSQPGAPAAAAAALPESSQPEEQARKLRRFGRS